jgi:hypothetical protein
VTTATLNRHERRQLAKIGRMMRLGETESLLEDLLPEDAAQALKARWDDESYAAHVDEAEEKVRLVEAVIEMLVQDGTPLERAVYFASGFQNEYPGLYPNHHQLLLDRGKTWQAEAVTLYRDIDPKAAAMLPGDGYCYANALHVAKRLDLKYGEGLALIEIVPEGYTDPQRMVVFHAWCLNPATGEVVEPFWPAPAKEMFGITYEIEQVVEAIADTGYFGLIINDHLRGFDLLTRGILGHDYFSKTG